MPFLAFATPLGAGFKTPPRAGSQRAFFTGQAPSSNWWRRWNWRRWHAAAGRPGDAATGRPGDAAAGRPGDATAGRPGDAAPLALGNC